MMVRAKTGKSSKKRVKKDLEGAAGKAAVMIVGGVDERDVKTWIADEYGKESLKEILDGACGIIAARADCDRKVALGKAVARFEEQYKAAEEVIKNSDGALRLKAIKESREITSEMARLMKLNEDVKVSDVTDGVKAVEEIYVRQHLEGVDGIPKGLPLEEAARRVAAMASGKRAAQVKSRKGV